MVSVRTSIAVETYLVTHKYEYEPVEPVLRDCSRDKKMWSLKTDGLLTQVNYSEKWTFGGLKGWSLNTGGLKDRFDCR